MRIGIITTIIFIQTILSYTAYAQEFRCRVMVQHTDIASGNREMFQEMQRNIEEFMNSRVWTDIKFEEIEKIDMRLNIRITQQVSNRNFTANFQIQASRPVYNSTYTTTIFNHVEENISFEYDENQTIDFSENSFTSNLSSVLAFYAYIVLGLDADTFASNGGTQFYQKAQQIAAAAVSHSPNEWGPSSNRENKYWLVENILNSTFSGFRNALYLYHRQGLDIMHDKPADGRKNIILALEELEQVHRVRPAAFLLSVFFYAKRAELISIFSEAMPDEKTQAVNLLKRLNPANVNDYDRILKQ